MKKITFFTLCLTLFLVGNLYAQETVWVSATGAGLKNGTSQANAYAGFSTAFVQINSAGDILRVVGTVPASAVSLNKNFAYTIQGDTGGSTLTGANAAVRMFTNNTASRDSQNVTFRNIKFTGATNSTGAGGGVLLSNQANTINFENCRFEGNSIAHASTGGGAIFIQTSTVNISDCLFKENQALTVNGGAIQVTSGTVTINRSTFYRNKTASTTATVGGGALYVLGGTVTANYCTFFQNTIGHIAPEYGTIRTAGGVTTVNNSLFYDNKMNATWTAGNPVTTGGALADWGSAGSIGSTLTKSLAQIISANVTNTNSNSTANLASSNLTYDDTSGKVRYQPAASGDATPIGFGDSSTDVGSWNCGTRVTPTFNAVAAICSGATLSALPTTSTNGIIGTWSPALDNTTTTTYTFTPNVGECATSRVTMTITVTPSTTTGSVTVSQNTPYTWAKNSVTYTETTNISIIEDCNTATLNFTLLASTPPTISALTSNGTIAITEGCGGSTLIITGADFSGATEVLVNGFTAIYTVNSSTQITATLPAGPIGPGVVTVTTPAGSGSSAGNFAVNANATPTFDSVAAICAGGTLSALPTTSDNGITGTWSPALNNTATTEYTFTPTAGLCATTATMTITVNACPADTFTWTGTSSNDWATAANWTKTAGTSPDGYPGQTPGRLIDNVVISNGGTPVVASGTYQIYSLAINNATGADSGSILTINSGATLTVNNTAVVAITLKGGSIVNNGTLNATSTNVGASFGIACLVPSVAPSTATEYGYSGSGTLNITTTLGNASSGGIQFNGTSANTTYKMLFNGTTAFNLNNTALAVYALRVVDGAKNPVIIGGAGFTLGTVGAPVNYGLLIMGNNGNNVTVNTGTTLTLNSAATNTALGINIAQTAAASADVTFTNKGTVAILGASSTAGINLSVDNSTNTLPAINKINFENQGTVNVDVAIGSSSNNASLRVQGAGTTAGLVTITNTATGVLNLKNSQPFTAVTGCPIRIFGGASTPAVTITNAGALSFTGQNINFGGSATKSAINNTGIINSSSEFQSFTITNETAGTINFNYNTPATSRSVTFAVAADVAATAGATYTDVAGNVYTVVLTKVNGTGTSLIGSFPLTGVPTPVPNKLTKTSGTGDTEISYNTSITTFEASPLSASDSAFINNGTVNTGTATNLNTFAAVTTSATSVIAPGGTGVGNTVIANASTVVLRGTLKLDIPSIVSSTAFDQITNSATGGGFNITNATLDLTGIFTPLGNRTINIVNTNATGTLTGNFASIIGLESNPRWSVNYITGTNGKVQLIYVAQPTVTSLTSDGTIAITEGCVGSTLVIKGADLTGATAVTVNGVAVASFVVTNSTTITAILPAGTIAAGKVVVTTPGGTGTSAGNFAVTGTTPTFTQVADICAGASLSALPTTSTNTTGITGTWSPALNNAATTIYTFTPTAGQCATTATMTITVNSNVTPTFTQVADICAGASLSALPTSSNNSITGTWSPALNNAATTIYTFTPTAGQCATTTTMTITVFPYTTWNGTAWSYGAPTDSIEAVIAGNYSTTTHGAIAAKKLTVNSGVLTVNSGNLTVVNELINNAGPTAVVLENNANLIQGGTTNTNTGNVIVKRNSNPLYILDYTMWSSPVSGSQTLAQFSPMTSIDPYIRFYTYDPANNWYKFAVPSSTFTTGTGYLIRMPKEGDATYIDGTAPLTHNGQFTGIPNNGTLTLSGLASDKFHSVGNPYPSTISADAFISGNSTGGMLYFWRKRNAQAGSAYATYNLVGGTASGNASTEVPNGTIQVGQGFIVKTAAEATTLAFTNAMRAGTVSTQIFKTKQVQKDRVWVNLTRPATKTGTIDIPEAFSQALIGYMDGATLGVDEGIDGKYINDSKVALTSNINDEEYTIQGRPKFDPADIVALNFKTDADSEYTIALDHFDGVFAAGQDVYLVDSKTGTETDLKAGAYTFNATSGIDNTRFSLKYQKTLKVDAPAFNENSVSVYKNNGALYVNSGFVAMSNIKVFDIQGRLVAEQKNLKSTTAVFNNLRAKNQVLIVKITGENNNVVSKKIVN
jgi:hypothetical protein